MRTALKVGLAIVVLIGVPIAIPTTWMPTVIGITVSDEGVAVSYNESAVGALVSGPSEATRTTTPSESPEGESDSTPVTSESGTTEQTNSARTAQLIHERVNAAREERGLPPLSRTESLDDVAAYHSRDMAREDYFAHTSPSGETLSDRYRRFDIGCSGGENIFKLSSSFGVSPEGVARQAVDGWMGSPGHRENILRGRFSAEGIGVVYDGGEVYVTQNFC